MPRSFLLTGDIVNTDVRGRDDIRNLPLPEILSIEAGIENLFDKECWEHLTREAIGNVPGLDPGE